MATAFYLSHPQAEMLPNKPVPNWPLSQSGRERLSATQASAWHQKISQIWTSTEIKALETAEFFARDKKLDVQTFVQMGEVERGSTGYLSSEAYEQARIAFYQRPNDSYKGWETARDAQKRVMRAIKLARLRHDGGDVLICGHSSIGTLLLTALADEPISIANEERPEGGNVFAFDLTSNELLFRWTPLEDLMRAAAAA